MWGPAPIKVESFTHHRANSTWRNPIIECISPLAQEPPAQPQVRLVIFLVRQVGYDHCLYHLISVKLPDSYLTTSESVWLLKKLHLHRSRSWSQTIISNKHYNMSLHFLGAGHTNTEGWLGKVELLHHITNNLTLKCNYVLCVSFSWFYICTTWSWFTHALASFSPLLYTFKSQWHTYLYRIRQVCILKFCNFSHFYLLLDWEFERGWS